MNNTLLHQNIFLVGPMGAGKTSIGRYLAELADLSFVDSDQEIEQQTGVTISWIFELEGEAGFRKRERAIIQKLTQMRGIVLATGGGCILDAENRQALIEHGTVIYLQVNLDTQLERTAQRKGTRPLLDNVVDPMQTLVDLQTLRDPLYRAVATRIYDTHQFAHPRAVAQQIYDDWRKND